MLSLSYSPLLFWNISGICYHWNSWNPVRLHEVCKPSSSNPLTLLRYHSCYTNQKHLGKGFDRARIAARSFQTSRRYPWYPHQRFTAFARNLPCQLSLRLSRNPFSSCSMNKSVGLRTEFFAAFLPFFTWRRVWSAIVSSIFPFSFGWQGESQKGFHLLHYCSALVYRLRFKWRFLGLFLPWIIPDSSGMFRLKEPSAHSPFIPFLMASFLHGNILYKPTRSPGRFSRYRNREFAFARLHPSGPNYQRRDLEIIFNKVHYKQVLPPSKGIRKAPVG